MKRVLKHTMEGFGDLGCMLKNLVGLLIEERRGVGVWFLCLAPIITSCVLTSHMKWGPFTYWEDPICWWLGLPLLVSQPFIWAWAWGYCHRNERRY